jgi:hypothetical protein
MTVVLTPFSFRTDELLDPRRLNANFEEYAEYSREAHSRRYLYWTEVHTLDAMADTDAEVSRRVPVVCRTDRTAECVGVRMFITATDGETWTLASDDVESWQDLAVAGAGSTEASGVYNGPAFAVDETPKELLLSASGTSTITAGRVELLMRSDRHAQGLTSSPYSPVTRWDDGTQDKATPVNTEIAAIASFVTSDGASNRGVHQDRYTFDGGVTLSYRVPSRRRRCLGVVIFAGGTGTAQVDVVDTSGPTTNATASVSPSATAVYDEDATTEVAQATNDPTNTAVDWSVDITTTGTLRGCAIVFWEA